MLQDEEKFQIKDKLDGMVRRGTRLYLDGRQASSEEIASACCLNEDAVYMPDYILDGDGRLAEIRYDKVSQK